MGLREMTLDQVKALGITGYSTSILLRLGVWEPSWSQEQRAPGHVERLDHLRSTVKHYMAQAFPDDLEDMDSGITETDFEDSVEYGERFNAMVQATGGTFAIEDNPSNYLIFSDGELVGTYPGPSNSEFPYLWGPVNPMHQDMHQMDHEWWTDPVIGAHTQRNIFTAGYAPDDPAAEDVYDAVRRMHAEGVERVFIKSMQFKVTAATEYTETVVDALDAGKMDPLDIILLNREGHSKVYIVQHFIPMQWEMRFMVVNGEVISGAASVEDHTPLDRIGSKNVVGVSNALMKQRRYGPDDTVLNKEVASALESAARGIVANYFQEHGKALWNCSLDMCMTEDKDTGEFTVPTVVELNDLSNSGLYANDVEAVAQAIFDGAKNGVFEREFNEAITKHQSEPTWVQCYEEQFDQPLPLGAYEDDM